MRNHPCTNPHFLFVLVTPRFQMSKFLFSLLLFGQFLGLIYYHWNYSSQSDLIQSLSLQNSDLSKRVSNMNKDLIKFREMERNCTIIYNEMTEKLSAKSRKFIPKGVAVTLLHDHPTWFQRRYTIMIQNILNNIPEDWVIQIFHANNKQFQAGMAISGGILKLIQMNSNRIIFTELPAHVTNERKRPIHLMLHPWLWENMLSDNVLVFGGNHVICSNSPYRLQDFMSYDYISAPWGRYKGIGGGSGMSLRNRKVMLGLIENRLEKTPVEEREKAYLEWGRDDEFFVGEMIQLNKEKNHDVYKLPTKEIVSRFSAGGGALMMNSTHFPFSVSDTLSGISLEDRAHIIDLCPEMKILFPSLHEPGCFGASLQRDKCAASICALNPKKNSC